MPATEQTWYDQKLLHVVFGATSIILLVSTVWMFAADHDREWKGYQRTFRRTEERLTSWRKSAEQSADYQATIAQLEAQLLEERAQALPGEAYDNFKNAVAGEAQQRGAKPETFDKSDQIALELAQRSDEAKAKQAEAAKASQAVNAAWERVAELKAAQADANEIAQGEEAAHQAEEAALEAEAEASAATKQAAALRGQLVQRMERSIVLARAREDDLAGQRKFRSADLDKARADLDILVRDSKFDEMEAQQGQIDAIAADLEALTKEAQDAAAHRVNLAGIVKSIQDAELNLNKEIEEHQAQVSRLESKLNERGLSYVNNFLPGKKWLTIPILDAFNSPLTIDNLWTDNLTISNGSFGQVRRFDRCTTCHRGIAKTAEGSATQPGFVPERMVDFVLQTPVEAPQPKTERGETVTPDLFSVYGFRLADRGLINANDVTVDYVKPTSLSATARVAGDERPGDVEFGFEVGDVILEINGDKILDAADVRQLLFEGIKWGETVDVKVRRGFPQPYSSHPRLDLFVGSLSPHKLSVFGCTSCHEGQGSATDFKWASHYPNDPREMKEWTVEHGWFNNHHWIYPMYPERFAESACLKCHHNVTELEPSERFPDPPAPKVVHGFHLIADYGCFGCHEINGYDGPEKRIGPDMRLEPNYYAAAAALKADPGFKGLSPSAVPEADRLIQHPDEDEVRHALRELVLADRYSDAPKLSPESHKMADVLQDTDTPGSYRKVGPTLRYVASKLGNEFMYDWIREPKHFRPSTKMPQFFGLWDHLQGDPEDLAKAEAYEQAEILGTVRYLMNRSQDFNYLPPEAGTAAASAERGMIAFEIRGCLACHQHEDFPAATSDQGPNLTGLGDKFAGSPDAQRWMYSWLKQPTHYSARTKMPNLYLDPYEDKDGTMIDPAADITAYLLSSTTGWKPGDDVAADLSFSTPAEGEALDALTLEYLEAAFSKKDAEKYLASGIPTTLQATLKGAEVELLGGASTDQKLMYIGRKTISKYGCYACHDIPGFEDAKPIGAALADWGRKESSKLAFEHIAEYLHEGHGTAHGGGGDHAAGHAMDSHAASGHGHAEDGHAEDGHAEPFDDSFYMYQISQLDRSGFIWQKLTEPRSYDYKKTRNKGYNEKLRMPLFPLNPEEREAVVTFVLGLVAEPPATEFVYQGDDRQRAITEGWAVIQKFNCAGCHMFEAEQWDIEFAEGDIRDPQSPPDYPFVAAHMSNAALADSAKIDPKRGVLHATLRGVQALRNDDALPDVLDGEGDPIEPEDLAYFDENHPEFDPDEYLLPLQYPFELWQPAAIEGQTYDVGLMRLTIPETMIKKKRPAVGGDLAKLLLPRVLELEKQDNPAANGTETWGWVPPPLLGEGQKVKPDWLYDFMLNPYPIRPAVFLRMPKFNLSPEDARKIVNYFAAKDNANYPFEYSARSQLAELDAMNAEFEAIHDTTESRFEHAMKIVTNSNYCIKCHLIGDYAPEGSVRALAPDLSMSQARLRPGYTRKWIAKPTSILPYTPMPVNIPYEGGVSQELYPGTSTEQVDALVDLLMNYSHYTNQQTDVSALVKAASGVEPTPDDSVDTEALAPASGAE